MLLQIWVLPPTEVSTRVTIPHSVDAAVAPPGARTFLESCPADVTLEELCTRIASRHDRIYPDQTPLEIKKLQDSFDLDLDLSFVVGDVFKDRDSANPKSSIVKVVRSASTRESSVPPQSALRPRHLGGAGQKRARGFGGADALQSTAPSIKRERHDSVEYCGEARRVTKRPRLQEIQRSVSPELDADRPILSRERDTPEVTMGGTADSGFASATPKRAKYGHFGRRSESPSFHQHHRHVPVSPILGTQPTSAPGTTATSTNGHQVIAHRDSSESMDELSMVPSAGPAGTRPKRMAGNDARTPAQEKRTRTPSLLGLTKFTPSATASDGPLTRRAQPAAPAAPKGRAPRRSNAAATPFKASTRKKSPTKPAGGHPAKRVVALEVTDDPIETDSDGRMQVDAVNPPAAMLPRNQVPEPQGLAAHLLRQRKRSSSQDPIAAAKALDEAAKTPRTRKGGAHQFKISASGAPVNEKRTASYEPGEGLGVAEPKDRTTEESTSVTHNASETAPTTGQAAEMKPDATSTKSVTPHAQETTTESTERRAPTPETKDELSAHKPGADVANPMTDEAGGNARRGKNEGILSAEKQGADVTALKAHEAGAQMTQRKYEAKSSAEKQDADVANLKADEAGAQAKWKKGDAKTSKERHGTEAANSKADGTGTHAKQKKSEEDLNLEALQLAKRHLKEEAERTEREWEQKKAAQSAARNAPAFIPSFTAPIKEGQRVSTTPPIPNGIRHSQRESSQKPVVGPEQSIRGETAETLMAPPPSIRRTVSFVDEILPGVKKYTQPGDAAPATALQNGAKRKSALQKPNRPSTQPESTKQSPPAATAQVPASIVPSVPIPVKETQVWPQGMGPEDLEAVRSRKLSIINAEGPGQATKPAAARSHKAQKGKMDPKGPQTTLKVTRDAKGKFTSKARLSPQPQPQPQPQPPAPAPAKGPAESKPTGPVEEILISSDEERSVASYYSSSPEENRASSQAKHAAPEVQGLNGIASTDAAEKSPDPAEQDPPDTATARQPSEKPVPPTDIQSRSKSPVPPVDLQSRSKSPVLEPELAISEPLALPNAYARSSLSRSPARFLSRTPSPAALGDENAGNLQQIAAAAEAVTEKPNSARDDDDNQARKDASVDGPTIETQRDSPMETTDDDDDSDSDGDQSSTDSRVSSIEKEQDMERQLQKDARKSIEPSSSRQAPPPAPEASEDTVAQAKARSERASSSSTSSSTESTSSDSPSSPPSPPRQAAQTGSVVVEVSSQVSLPRLAELRAGAGDDGTPGRSINNNKASSSPATGARPNGARSSAIGVSKTLLGSPLSSQLQETLQRRTVVEAKSWRVRARTKRLGDETDDDDSPSSSSEEDSSSSGGSSSDTEGDKATTTIKKKEKTDEKGDQDKGKSPGSISPSLPASHHPKDLLAIRSPEPNTPQLRSSSSKPRSSGSRTKKPASTTASASSSLKGGGSVGGGGGGVAKRSQGKVAKSLTGLLSSSSQWLFSSSQQLP